MDTEDCRMIDVWILTIVCLAVLMALATIRLVLGPTVPDRVIALDTVNTLTIAAMILFGVVFKEIIFVDVAIVYGLLSFVSTLYIAKYIGGEL
jgi:multicomponent Na+:H+ antiporter subunit F